MIGGGLYDHLMSKRIITLIIKYDNRESSEYYEANDYGHNLDSLITLYELQGSYHTESG